jgi:hypothetical protein
MSGMAWKVVSVISTQTVACRSEGFQLIFQVERLEQHGFVLGGEPGQRVAGQGKLVQEAEVGGLGGGGLQGVELGLELVGFGAELGEPAVDPGAHLGGAVRVVGEVLEGEDLGFLAGLVLFELQEQGGAGGVAAGLTVGVGGGELGGDEGGAAGAEDVGVEELTDDAVQDVFGSLDGGRVAECGGGLPGVVRVVGAPVVDGGDAGGVAAAGHAAAFLAPAPGPVGVDRAGA